MKTDLVVAVAHSMELDSLLAVAELIENCEGQLDKHLPVAGILYASIDAEHQLVLDKIYEKWPDLNLIGCTSDGEFSSEGAYGEDSMVLTLFASEEIKFVSGFVDNATDDMNKECHRALVEAQDVLGQAPKLCILFSDVISTNGETVLEQMTIASERKLPIVGGISADSWRFTESKQFCNKMSSPSISPFLFLAGPFDFSYGMDSGWGPIGEIGIVTKSEANILYEINHKPALEFYRDILGESAKPTLELPIALYDEADVFLFMRTSFENYNKDTGEITYLGNIPVGSKVRITMVNRDSILEGAKSSINHAMTTFPSDKMPVISLCFSCSARRILLGTRTKEECQILHSALAAGTKFSGFYTYGEFCPNLVEPLNKFHNETFVTVLLG